MGTWLSWSRKVCWAREEEFKKVYGSQHRAAKGIAIAFDTNS
jgi:hypothetical protein